MSRLLLIFLLLFAPLLAEALDDPMRPPSETPAEKKKKQRPGYYLSAIRVTGERYHAVINGRSYREGDRIGAGRVERILASEVVLSMPWGAQTLHFVPVRIKKGHGVGK